MSRVAPLMVVVIHCVPWPQQGGFASVLYPELGLLAPVSVPLFVILSGVLLAYRRDAAGAAPG
jgi:peptidoglycan/LPS O-acetylase OafA/YrhL